MLTLTATGLICFLVALNLSNVRHARRMAGLGFVVLLFTFWMAL